MNAKTHNDRRAALSKALNRRTADGDEWLVDLRKACAELSASLLDEAEAIKLRVTALELAIMAVTNENRLGACGDALTQLTQDLLVAIEALEAKVDFRDLHGD